jgi:hypothetical protein
MALKTQSTASPQAWLTLLAILGTFAVNVWSNLSPINGQNIGEISNTLFAEVQILPASYAFAIWGVIYLGLMAFGIYQLLPSQQNHQGIRQARPLLVVACVAQAIWVVLFLYRQFWLSVLAMLAILLPLILLYLRLRIAFQPVSRAEKWLVQVPFSIYLGWISVATIVNVASALYSQNWNGGGISAEVWTVIMMLVAAIVGALITLRRQDAAYPLVIVWALIAIAVRQAGTPLIATTATVLAIGLGLLVFLRSTVWRPHSRHPN